MTSTDTTPPMVERPLRAAMAPVDRLTFHPANIRRDLGDLRDLEASIRRHGILQPLHCEDHGAPLRVVAGHRRLAAARIIGLRRVPVVVGSELDVDEAMLLMLGENLARTKLSDNDRQVALNELLEVHGHRAAALGDALGVSATTIRKWAQPPESGPHRPSRQQHRDGRRTRVATQRVTETIESWSQEYPQAAQSPELAALLDRLQTLWAADPPLPSTDFRPVLRDRKDAA